MAAVLKELNNYAQLINFVLLASIIGWVFRMSRLSRIAIEDKYKAMLASREREVQHLRLLMEDKDAHHKGELAVLQQRIELFKERVSHLATPGRGEDTDE